MWVPGNLPPNLIFLITITPERRPVFQLSDASDAVAAHAADEAVHLQDVNRRAGEKKMGLCVWNRERFGG